ncbi:MAG: L-serine ammonia-lyase, iron-sulfur-dependent, subunit alpha, partial [Agathobacter sp.]|nr:L-serine ammonia-lyase, iron-sulfur-dependent, subunit alpha [Agathobacter sp.]
MYKSLEDIIVAEKETHLPFWKIVMQDDCIELDISEEESFQRMKRMYQVMKEADNAYEDNLMSRSGLVGTDGKKIHDARLAGKLVCGDFIGRVIERAIKMG